MQPSFFALGVVHCTWKVVSCLLLVMRDGMIKCNKQYDVLHFSMIEYNLCTIYVHICIYGMADMGTSDQRLRKVSGSVRGRSDTSGTTTQDRV